MYEFHESECANEYYITCNGTPLGLSIPKDSAGRERAIQLAWLLICISQDIEIQLYRPVEITPSTQEVFMIKL